jgi:hypothetical protein
MKIKPHRPRSCLGWFAWVFGILLLIFVSGNVYAQVRLAIARTQAEALARELGYTPDDFLLYRKDTNNVNIITGSAACDAELYFVTSLGFDEFEAKLMQAMPGTLPTHPTPWWDLWWNLRVDAYDVNGDKVEDEDSQHCLWLDNLILLCRPPPHRPRSTASFCRSQRMAN